MLATKAFEGIIKNTTPNSDGSITVRRSNGVCKAFTIPKEFLPTSAVECAFAPIAATKQLQVCEGNVILTIADEIGIKDKADFDVTMLDGNKALIELVAGSIFVKNANDVAFGFNTTGNLIRDTSNVNWVKASELLDRMRMRLKTVYHVSDKGVDDYVYNVTMRFNTQYTVYTPAQAKEYGAGSTYRQSMPTWTDTISLKQFDLIEFDEEKPKRKVFGRYVNEPVVKSFEDMSYEEQEEYCKKLAEEQDKIEQAKEDAHLASYESSFDDSDFDDVPDDYDEYADEDYNNYNDSGSGSDDE